MNAFDFFYSFESDACPCAPSLPLANVSANLLRVGAETLEFSEDPE